MLEKYCRVSFYQHDGIGSFTSQNQIVDIVGQICEGIFRSQNCRWYFVGLFRPSPSVQFECTQENEITSCKKKIPGKLNRFFNIFSLFRIAEIIGLKVMLQCSYGRSLMEVWPESMIMRSLFRLLQQWKFVNSQNSQIRLYTFPNAK